MCVHLATDHDANAPAHASMDDSPVDELALMELPCSCCIGHSSSHLWHAATIVIEMGVIVFFQYLTIGFLRRKQIGEGLGHQFHQKNVNIQ